MIESEMEHIDDKLQMAIDTYSWANYEKVYIDDLHEDLKNLNLRIIQTKSNLERIIKSLRKWGTQPMYVRHENINSNLMWPEDFPTMIEKRRKFCLNSKELIDEMIEENFRLFFNLPLKNLNSRKLSIDAISQTLSGNANNVDSMENDGNKFDVSERDKIVQAGESHISLKSLNTPSTTKISDTNDIDDKIVKKDDQLKLFLPYCKYVDHVIWSEIREALYISIKYIKYEMENRLSHNAPLFEAKLELIEDIVTFIPKMDVNYGNPTGLMEIITTMIANILNMSQMLPLIAQNDKDRIETFTNFLVPVKGQTPKDVEDIVDMQMDIMGLTRDAIREAISFAKKFEKYRFLWKNDKSIQLASFLKYGRLLTNEEIEKIEEGEYLLDIPESHPNLEKFRFVIEYYVKIYEEINDFDITQVFSHWLRINLKVLKQSLLNEVCKWSHLFKNYLQKKVVNDLKELQDFIEHSTAKLNQNVTNEDAATLLSILKTISQINERSEQTDKMFDPLREIVDLLKSFDVEFEDFVEDQFAQLPESWITLKKHAVIVKRNIAPVQAYQVDLIKKRINLFDVRTKLFYENFMKSKLLRYPCRNVYELCDLIHEDLVGMENQCNALKEQSIHFNLNPPEEGRMSYCRRMIRLLKHMWDFHFAVSSCVDDWKQTAWKKINVDEMETECKRFSKVIFFTTI